MFQYHYQTTKPVTTAHLAQTMTLLSLTVEELHQKVESEISTNPALEITEEIRCPKCQRVITNNGVCPVCSRPSNKKEEELVVFVSPREDFIHRSDYQNEEYLDNDISQTREDLPTYVLRQAATELDKEDCKIAAFLLTNLNEDGFLTTKLEDIASYFHISVEKVDEIKKVIQRLDPLGVGSHNTDEALLVQLEILSERKSVPELAYKIIRDDMELLTHRQYAEIAKKYQTTQREVLSVIQFIGDNLNPFPGRSHWGDIRQAESSPMDLYRSPDIIISYLNDNPEDQLVVEIILPIRGTLRINPLFKDAVKSAEEDQREEWKNDLDRASLFVKCLQQRYHTMERLMQNLVTIQKDYIKHGDKYLKPITRVQLSNKLDVHESTISRAVANKTIQLPNRKIIPLSSFFDRSLNIRSTIKDIIAEEKKPLSDAELVDKLDKLGISVARRTVAKYRTMEGILPAHLRQVQTVAT